MLSLLVLDKQAQNCCLKVPWEGDPFCNNVTITQNASVFSHPLLELPLDAPGGGSLESRPYRTTVASYQHSAPRWRISLVATPRDLRPFFSASLSSLESEGVLENLLSREG